MNSIAGHIGSYNAYNNETIGCIPRHIMSLKRQKIGDNSTIYLIACQIKFLSINHINISCDASMLGEGSAVAVCSKVLLSNAFVQL